MNSHLREIFETETGRLSSNRIIFVLASFWNIAISTYMILRNTDPSSVLVFFSGVQGVVSGGKLIQKQMEKGTIKKENYGSTQRGQGV